jgi:hypothetical protein
MPLHLLNSFLHTPTADNYLLANDISLIPRDVAHVRLIFKNMYDAPHQKLQKSVWALLCGIASAHFLPLIITASVWIFAFCPTISFTSKVRACDATPKTNRSRRLVC